MRPIPRSFLSYVGEFTPNLLVALHVHQDIYIVYISLYIISHISPQTSHRHKVQPLNSIFTPQVWAISCHFCPLLRSRSAPRMPRCWSSAAFRSSGGDLQRWSIITGWWFQPGLYLYSHIMSHIVAGWFISVENPYIYIYTHGWWFQPTPLKNDGLKVSSDDDIPN